MKLINKSGLVRCIIGVGFWCSCITIAVAQNKPVWTTLSNDTKDFFVDVPSDYLVDKEERRTSVYAYDNAASFTIRFEKVDKPKSYVMGPKYPKEKSIASEKYEIGDFAIRTFEYEADGEYTKAIYAGSSQNYYFVSGTSNNKENLALNRFLNSIRFEGKGIFRTSSALTTSTKLTSFLALSTSPEVLAALSVSDNSSAMVQLARMKEKQSTDFAAYSRGLIILRKPVPSYTDEARMNNKQGTIRARVEFLKNGQIGSTVVDNLLDKGLSTNVGEVIKRIKFVPAEINGKPVDVTRIVEYTFSIY